MKLLMLTLTMEISLLLDRLEMMELSRQQSLIQILQGKISRPQDLIQPSLHWVMFGSRG